MTTDPKPLEHDRPFLHYMREHKRTFGLGIAAIFFTDVLDVLTPLALKAGIDAVVEKDSDGLASAIVMFVGLMIGVTIFRYLWRIYFGRFHHTVADDLRNRIYFKLTELGPSYFNRTTVGSLMSLLTSDVNSFRMAIGPGMVTLLDSVFYILLIVPVMISLSWDWTWKTLIFLPAIPFIMRRLETLIHERYRVQQDRLAEVSGRAQEIVSGVRVIKGFAQEDNQAKSFNTYSQSYENACNKVAQVDSAFTPAMESAVAIGSVILLYVGTPEVMRESMTLGTFVAFHEYIKRMVWPMSAMGMGISMVEQGRASFDRIRELLTTPTDIPDKGTKTLERFEKLEVKNLTFRYPSGTADSVQNISFTIQAGETIGLVGPVGAGKTTLLQLITRLYPSPEGSIFINGIELSDIKRSSLSRIVSYVTQDSFLFSDTIAENIALGIPVFPGFEKVEEVAHYVNIDGEIREIPGAYEAWLGERGVNLSGGQKQRLTIARALIRRSSLVILDDSLSAVDGKTEKTITQALRRAKEELREETGSESNQPSVILVSHRLATLKHADRIIVMNRGHLEAIGTHDDLVATNETYRHLNELQTSPAVAPEDGLEETGGTQ